MLWFSHALTALLISRHKVNVWSFLDVGREATVQSLCERWWNRSDISSELRKEIPAGARSRGGIGEEGRNGERCDPFGVTLFSDPLLLRAHRGMHAYTQTRTKILCPCAGWCTHAKKDECLRNKNKRWTSEVCIFIFLRLFFFFILFHVHAGSYFCFSNVVKKVCLNCEEM